MGSEEQVKKRVAFYSVLVNVFLSVLKILTGIVSGSKALIADGVHSVSDLAASLSVLAGIHLSHRRLKGFPYGLYKVENIVAILSAFAIFFAGYELAKDAVNSGEFSVIENFPVAYTGILITLAVTFFFSRYEFQVGKRLSSPSLMADSSHVRADMFSALVVLAGVVGSHLKIFWAERAAVIGVVLFIFRSGVGILVESVRVLLDASIDPKTLDEIKKIMLSHPMVSDVRSLTGRNSGSYKFVEADLVVRTDSLRKAHDVSHEIEKIIKEKVPFIERILIHMEPEMV